MTADEPQQTARRERRAVLLRLDPAVHDALARWAADDLRSLNAHVEMLLRRALDDAGRTPSGAGPLPRRGRPRRAAPSGDARPGPDVDPPPAPAPAPAPAPQVGGQAGH
ncbi:hypothetical protein [Cellulomonas soli]|uniref:Arc-like DNA binding domain-containing protein n=1 Tax=Cellulomonas soli TaxID=931535 RepID=A0A512PDD5_9CELL|nr:hypothetical protein [Cellulomonas soli]NYI60127.1 hypothetical protein [Cellulomonas soli]GEP69220.1 hypothetical protein CSO01_19350 [Cellulomonas soli]